MYCDQGTYGLILTENLLNSDGCVYEGLTWGNILKNKIFLEHKLCHLNINQINREKNQISAVS